MAGLVSAFLAVLSASAVTKIYSVFLVPYSLPVPGWFHALVYLAAGFTNYGLGLMIAMLFVIIALRQRMRPMWPIAGIALIASLVTAEAQFAAHLPVITPHSHISYVLFSTLVTFPPSSQHPLALSIFLFRMLLILLPATATYLALRQRLRASARSA